MTNSISCAIFQRPSMKSGVVSTNVLAARTEVTSRPTLYTALATRESEFGWKARPKKAAPDNRRLNTAYLLKESFGQLWDYRTERGARAFFER